VNKAGPVPASVAVNIDPAFDAFGYALRRPWFWVAPKAAAAFGVAMPEVSSVCDRGGAAPALAKPFATGALQNLKASKRLSLKVDEPHGLSSRLRRGVHHMNVLASTKMFTGRTKSS